MTRAEKNKKNTCAAILLRVSQNSQISPRRHQIVEFDTFVFRRILT